MKNQKSVNSGMSYELKKTYNFGEKPVFNGFLLIDGTKIDLQPRNFQKLKILQL